MSDWQSLFETRRRNRPLGHPGWWLWPTIAAQLAAVAALLALILLWLLR